MKKTVVVIVIVALVFWANTYKNELSVWFNSEVFYQPIYESNFDVLHAGSSVHAELKGAYAVRHGFFLVFPCDGKSMDFYDHLDGVIRYSIHSRGIELESKTMALPAYPMKGLSYDGICDVALFTFDLPFKGYESVTLDVVVESPIKKLAPRQDIRCKVSPAYWPK